MRVRQEGAEGQFRVDAFRRVGLGGRCHRLPRATRPGGRDAAAHALDVFRSQGTVYMLVDIAASALPAREFTLRLLDEFRVAVAPGEVFGPGGAGLVCISFAVEPDVLAGGLSRIARAIETFAA